MNMFEAIFSKKTFHHFIQEKIEWEVIADILKFADNLPMFIDGIAVEFKLVSNIEKKQGFNGLLAVKAPYYLCISSEAKEDYLLNAGYLIQQLNLYITSKGLGTCFVGSAKPGSALKASMKYEYILALAFGKTSKPELEVSEEKRLLPEKDVVVYKENVRSEVKQVINAARLAPSNMNSQPWRFVVYPNRIHIFSKKNIFLNGVLNRSKTIDMGIMLANLFLAAEELWVDISMTKSESIMNKQFNNNEYILSILIS